MATTDELGALLKSKYESVTQLVLPRKTHTIIRLDGNAFHTYTRGCVKPFDQDLHNAMIASSVALLAKAMGARLAYTQSDEVSLLLTDFENPGTEPWFGGNVQKITSVSASIFTARFNQARFGASQPAFFDARVFTIDDPGDVVTYFQWRRADAWRNAVYSAARAYFSHKQLQGKGGLELLTMLSEAGVGWETFPRVFKFGTLIHRKEVVEDVTFVDGRTREERVARDVKRHVWAAIPAHLEDVFTHLEPCLLR